MKGRISATESFGSVDGPGIRFIVFVQGCRYRCQYCHNPETWEREGGYEATAEEIFRQAWRYRPYWKRTGGITVSGGEPLLHHKEALFYEFVCELLARGYEVHFETNGTILVDFEKFPAYKSCVFVISPKLSTSAEPRERRLNFAALRSLKQNAKDSFYKFVISPEFDAQPEISEILAACESEVYCMPRGADRRELESGAQFCVDFCLKNGYNYSDRLHIRIWGEKDGV